MKSQVLQLRASPATFQGLMDADRELGQDREADLILAFLPPDGSIDDTIGAMAEVWPSSQRMGCEAVHQFAGGEVAATGCLHFFWLDRPGHRIWVEVLQGSRDVLPDDQAVEKACRSLTAADAVLLLADGLRFPTRYLVTELRRHRASLPPVIGGALASSYEPVDAGGTGARVFCDTFVFPSACLLLGFEGVGMDVELVHDFQPASPIYTVTAADNRVVHEIDGEPAVDWYGRFFTVDGQLAPMPQSAHSFPLIIEGPDPSRRRLCRAMRAFDAPEGAVTYWGDVREGEQVRLGLGQDLSLVRTATRMASKGHAEAALLATFAGRQALLGEGAESELADLYATLGAPALSGIFSFSELGPTADASLGVHNQTALLALLREKGQ